MKCEESLLLISGHMDGENTPEEENMLQAHLETCPHCRGILQAYLDVDNGVAALQEEPPENLVKNVMAAIEKPKKKNRTWPTLAAAAAVALVIGLGAGRLPLAAPQAEADLMVARSVAEECLPVTVDPQILAEERQANVAVTDQWLEELDSCTFEVLADGSCLYLLSHEESAEELAAIYDLEVFFVEEARQSYMLLRS